MLNLDIDYHDGNEAPVGEVSGIKSRPRKTLLFIAVTGVITDLFIRLWGLGENGIFTFF